MGKSNMPAKEIVEVNLMEEFHWTPQQIAQIGFKDLQKINIVRSNKVAIMENKATINNWKSQATSQRQGQSRRFTREI